jgi:8-hydroxy-5-deazaflavin:NADPH oxidoreductase
MMNICIIGTGNVGGALAQTWAKAGHRIRLGVRDTAHFKGADLLAISPNITAHPTPEAVAASEVIVIAATPQATHQIAESLGDVTGKVIIDAMNSVRVRPDGYPTSTHALLHLTNTPDVVKCFNTTGFENMLNPRYGAEGITMFVAGDSARGKETARHLALDAGFHECLDFGGSDKFELLESLALCWINLALMQGHGRDIAFQIVRR